MGQPPAGHDLADRALATPRPGCLTGASRAGGDQNQRGPGSLDPAGPLVRVPACRPDPRLSRARSDREAVPDMTTLESAGRQRHPSVHRADPQGRARRSATPPGGDALADPGARRRPYAGRAAGHDAGAAPVLGDRVRRTAGRIPAERAAAVHHRDRRRGHPLRARQVRAPGRAAADHDPRLAGLGHRDARLRRPAHRPHRARRHRRGRVPPRAAVTARVRLLGRAGRDRVGSRPYRAGMVGAHAPARLRPLRGPGR